MTTLSIVVTLHHCISSVSLNSVSHEMCGFKKETKYVPIVHGCPHIALHCHKNACTMLTNILKLDILRYIHVQLQNKKVLKSI